MKKIFLFVLIGILSGLTAIAQQPSKEVLRLSLEDCLEFAFKDNFNRQSVELNESANQETYIQAKMERLPNLNASIGETYTHSNNTGSEWIGNYSLNTGFTIYQGGYINHTIDKSRLSAEQSKYRTTQFENDLTIQVLQSFLTALGNEELLRYQSAVLKASEEQANQGKVRFESGDILESDYMLLEAQFEVDQNNMLETTISQENSLNMLKNLMSLDLSQAIEIIYPDDSVLDALGDMPSEAEVVSRSIETLPDLRISDYNVEIAEAGVHISRSAYSPSLSLNASMGSGHMNDFSNYGSQLSDRLNEQIGLTLSIPIFNRNRTKSNVSQNKIALQRAELERKQTELDVRQTLIQEYGSVVLAESKYRSSQIRLSAYQASFQAYQMKFEQGSITTVELLQQQNNYINVMNDFVKSKYGFMLKRKVLDVYMGEPVSL
jgi:outer membrane protein